MVVVTDGVVAAYHFPPASEQAVGADWTGGGRGHVRVPGVGGEATAMAGDSRVSRGPSRPSPSPAFCFPLPPATWRRCPLCCLAVTPSSCEPRPALLCCLCSPCLPMAIRCLLITLACHCQCSNSSRFRLWSVQRLSPVRMDRNMILLPFMD